MFRFRAFDGIQDLNRGSEEIKHQQLRHKSLTTLVRIVHVRSAQFSVTRNSPKIQAADDKKCLQLNILPDSRSKQRKKIEWVVPGVCVSDRSAHLTW